jgi:hypothetical protein
VERALKLHRQSAAGVPMLVLVARRHEVNAEPRGGSLNGSNMIGRIDFKSNRGLNQEILVGLHVAKTYPALNAAAFSRADIIAEFFRTSMGLL